MSVRFLTIFFIIQIRCCTLWGNQKPQLSGKLAIVKQNGTRGQLYNDYGVPLALWCSRLFGVIRCTYFFFRKYKFQCAAFSALMIPPQPNLSICVSLWPSIQKLLLGTLKFKILKKMKQILKCNIVANRKMKPGKCLGNG